MRALKKNSSIVLFLLICFALGLAGLIVEIVNAQAPTSGQIPVQANCIDQQAVNEGSKAITLYILIDNTATANLHDDDKTRYELAELAVKFSLARQLVSGKDSNLIILSYPSERNVNLEPFEPIFPTDNKRNPRPVRLDQNKLNEISTLLKTYKFRKDGTENLESVLNSLPKYISEVNPEGTDPVILIITDGALLDEQNEGKVSLETKLGAIAGSWKINNGDRNTELPINVALLDYDRKFPSNEISPEEIMKAWETKFYFDVNGNLRRINNNYDFLIFLSSINILRPTENSFWDLENFAIDKPDQFTIPVNVQLEKLQIVILNGSDSIKLIPPSPNIKTNYQFGPISGSDTKFLQIEVRDPISGTWNITKNNSVSNEDSPLIFLGKNNYHVNIEVKPKYPIVGQKAKIYVSLSPATTTDDAPDFSGTLESKVENQPGFRANLDFKPEKDGGGAIIYSADLPMEGIAQGNYSLTIVAERKQKGVAKRICELYIATLPNLSGDTVKFTNDGWETTLRITNPNLLSIPFSLRVFASYPDGRNDPLEDFSDDKLIENETWSSRLFIPREYKGAHLLAQLSGPTNDEAIVMNDEWESMPLSLPPTPIPTQSPTPAPSPQPSICFPKYEQGWPDNYDKRKITINSVSIFGGLILLVSFALPFFVNKNNKDRIFEKFLFCFALTAGVILIIKILSETLGGFQSLASYYTIIAIAIVVISVIWGVVFGFPLPRLDNVVDKIHLPIRLIIGLSWFFLFLYFVIGMWFGLCSPIK